MSKFDEWAEDLTEEQKKWIEDVDERVNTLEKKLESGEVDKSVINPWTSENWQAKARSGPTGEE